MSSSSRPLQHSRSSPSLAVGLPPPLPIMATPSPLKRSRSKRIHRGDVESSTDSEEDQVSTPKRRVIHTVAQTEHKPPRVKAIPKSKSTSFVHESTDKVVVCVRIKPTTSPFASSAYELSQTSLTLSSSHPSVLKRGGKAGREAEYTYTFDALLQFPSRTPDLYEAKIAPLVQKAMNGFNSTIFAYGQTGSGKSFTMTGTESELGIIPCAVDGVFDAINAEPSRAYLLRVSYIEIYNETLRDLLAPDEKPVIHTAKGKTYVEPLTEEIVSTPQDIVDILQRGNAGRKVGATDWNDRSSRSHCVFTIVIESRPQNSSDDIRLSRLNLIDLAGSEKAVTDVDRRGEGKHINQSLLALREVVHKLTEKKKTHIPYRNSKLTHLLENALGGDSNICVICTLSAEEEHCGETLETLKFAGRCSQVETKAQKHILPSSERAVIRAKDEEIEQLKIQLQTLASQQPITDVVATMEARKERLTEQLAKLNGEILTSDVATNRPKRRRISEFRGIGLGQPKGPDRRVFSMVSIAETPREHVQLEKSRSELLRLLEEKDAKINTLENSILDLRSSREELLIEAEGRVEEYRGKFDKEAEQNQTLKGDIARLKATFKDEVAEFEQAFEDLQNERNSLQVEHESTTAILHRLQADHAALRAQNESAMVTTDGLKNELVGLQSSRQLLVDDFAKTRSAYEELQSIHNSNLGQMDTLRQHHDALQASQRADSAALSKLQEEYSIAQTHIQSSDRQIEQLQVECTALQNRHDSMLAEIVNLREENSALQSSYRSAAAQAIDLEKGHATLQSEHQTRLLSLQGTIAEVEKGKEDTLAKQKAETSVLQTTIAQLRQVQTELEMKIQTLTAEHSALQHQFTELDNKYSTSQLENTSLTRERDAAITALDDYQRAAMSSKAQSDAELTAEVAAARKSRDEERVERQKVEKRLEVVESQHESTKVKLVALRSAIEEERTEKQRLEQLVSTGEIKRESLEAELARIKATLEVERSSSRSQAEENLQLARQLDDSQKSKDSEIAASRAQVESLSKKNQNLGQQVANGISEIERLKSDIKSSSTKCDGLALQISSLEKRLAAELARAGELSKLRSTEADTLNDLQQSLSSSARTVKDLQEKLSNITTERLELQSRNGLLEKEVESRSSVVEEQSDKIRLLVSQIKDLERILVAERETRGQVNAAHLAAEGRQKETERRIEERDTAEANYQAEIERLEHLIEDQKQHISYWKNELDKQGQVIKGLTDNCSCGSKSISRPDDTSLSRSRSKMTSTFTARNLALPSFPTPLPLHPSQFSNIRTRRRVTIEHDMDRLTDSNKVTKTKAVFDSPSASPSPTKPSRSGSANLS